MDPRHPSPERDEDSKQTGADQHESPTSRTEPDKFRRCTKDEDFWYEDGDVVLLVGNTALRLHALRLAGYCGYFHELFSPGRRTGITLRAEAEGCIVYHMHVTPELSLTDFKHLLKVLESPFEYATKPFSQELAISLLFAADTLSCGYVLDLAKKRLCEIWDGRTPPTTDRTGSEDRTIHSAIRAIKVARQYAISGVLKRAFYELLSNWTFGRELEYAVSDQSAIDELRIAEGDVHKLLAVRLQLGRLWRGFVMQAPRGAWCVPHRGPCSAHRCCHAGEETRAGKWRNFVCERGLLEVVDPLRCDLIKEWRETLGNKKWCQACLDRKRKAWEDERADWWEQMDEWFGLH